MSDIKVTDKDYPSLSDDAEYVDTKDLVLEHILTMLKTKKGINYVSEIMLADRLLEKITDDLGEDVIKNLLKAYGIN